MMLASPKAAGAVVLDEKIDAAKLSFTGVSKIFEKKGQQTVALTDIDLVVKPEEFVALVGPSGCGKSTLLNLIAGQFAATTGTVTYDGEPVTQLNHRVGYMTQKDTLLPWRTAADNIGIALELQCRKVPKSERRDRVQQMVELVGLKGFENHYPGELSGGMRKRAGIARTLIYEPETLLMDEPFGALDAQLKLVMQDQLQRITQQRRMTVLFVTHDLAEAVALADRVVVFSARPGRIRKIREVPQPRPRDVFNASFNEEFALIYRDLWNELKEEVAKGTEY